MRVLLLLVLFSASAHAQTLPAIGTDATFDLATWNIERFGESSGETQFENVLAVLSQGDVDLWALQEVNDRGDFDDLVAALGDGWDSEWTSGTGSLGYGFIYRTAVVQDLQATTILTDQSYNFASRPPLLLRANLTLPSGTVENVRFINIHAKCCGDGSSYDRRVAASAALKNYVDNFLTIDAPIVVLGDFNDELRNSIAGGPSPYQGFRDDEEDYRFVTLPLDIANVPTFCGNNACSSGSTLDHILLTRPVEDLYVEGSMNRFGAVLDGIPNYVSTTSDHVPVYAQLDFAPMTDAAADAATPQPFSLRAPFPNPFRTTTRLTYTLPSASTVTLDIFDALGRRVATVEAGTRPAGRHEVDFEAGSLPAGLYIARLTADGQHATRRLVLLP